MIEYMERGKVHDKLKKKKNLLSILKDFKMVRVREKVTNYVPYSNKYFSHFVHLEMYTSFLSLRGKVSLSIS